MAQGVYTKRLLAVSVSVGNPQTSPICPAGRAWIVRDILITNPTPNQAVAQVSIPGFFLVYASIPPRGDGYHLDLRQRLNEGEAVTVAVDSGAVNAFITYYDLASD